MNNTLSLSSRTLTIWGVGVYKEKRTLRTHTTLTTGVLNTYTVGLYHGISI